jgi:hypothetical protein
MSLEDKYMIQYVGALSPIESQSGSVNQLRRI